MKIHCSHSEVKKLDELIANPKNPNQHPRPQIELLAKILTHQGWRNPIVVSKRSGFITKGHARLEAAKLAGFNEAPIDLQDYPNEAMEWADMIADNAIAELAHQPVDLVKNIALELGPDFDLDLLGIPDFKARYIDLEFVNDSPDDKEIKKTITCPECGFQIG